jgi:hypothetical protein
MFLLQGSFHSLDAVQNLLHIGVHVMFILQRAELLLESKRRNGKRLALERPPVDDPKIVGHSA